MRFLKDVKKYYKYAFYAARAQLKSEVTNSYLDWLWWILEPFSFMIIYSVIFGIIFNSSEPYFPIFIFSGNAMWMFFCANLGASVKLVKMNEVTVSKVYLPKFILLLVEMLVNAYKMSLSFGIVAVMLLVFKVPITWRVILIIPIFLVFFIFTFGLCSISLHFGVYIEDLSYVVSIGTNMMVYFTGIFYSLENKVPAPYGNLLATLNPVAFLMSSMRKVLLYSQTPSYKILGVWFVISVGLAIAGIKIIYKNENSYVKVI